LYAKDEQIEKLNENMHKQAVHIQTLIQENNRLSVKLLLENTEKISLGGNSGNFIFPVF
jgi:hypothetical protein